MNKKIFSKEVEKQIVDMYSNSSNLSETGRNFNVDRAVIKRILLENGIEINSNTKSRKHTLNENFFDSIDTEEKAYFLGFLYADGIIHEHKASNGTAFYQVRLSLQEDDYEILEKLSSAISYSGDLRYIKPNKTRYSKRGQYALDISSKKLTLKLLEIGIKDKENIPNIIPEKLIHHFIRGYFNGDGCISIFKKGDAELYIMALPLMLSNIAKAMDMRGKPIQEVKGGMYKLRFHGKDDIVSVYNYLYKDATIYLKRKYDKCAVLGLNHESPKIITAELSGEAEMPIRTEGLD